MSWALIIVLYTTNGFGQVTNLTSTTINGFKSQQQCIEVANRYMVPNDRMHKCTTCVEVSDGR